MILTPADLLALCQRHGVPPGVARIATACALVESGGVTDGPPGDNGHSVGLWQLHDAGLGAGMTVVERQDPDTAAARILPVFVEQWIEGMAQGLDGERLARYVAIWTERPAGWPDLDSPAADRYAAMWQTIGEPMPATITYNPDQPAELQVQDWACSIRTATWMLKSLGFAVDAGTLQDQMVPRYVTPAQGLLDWRGIGLQAFLTDQTAMQVHQCAPITWEQVVALAGSGPLGLGGQAWNHWVAVRRSNDDGTLALANPAPGYEGVTETLWPADFARLGPMAAVWIPVAAPSPEPTPDEDPCAALISQLGYLTGDLADILQRNLDAARSARTKKVRDAKLLEIQNAISTLRRGGG